MYLSFFTTVFKETETSTGLVKRTVNDVLNNESWRKQKVRLAINKDHKRCGIFFSDQSEQEVSTQVTVSPTIDIQNT